MDRKLMIDSLPPVVGNIREIKLLMESEQGEIDELWSATKDTLKEGFLDTQSTYGASRWEKNLNIRPKGTDTLQVRNCRILAKLNGRFPYTIRMLQERIQTIVKDKYEIVYKPDDYYIEVIVIGHELKILQIIREMAEEMIPLNLFFLFTGKEKGWFSVPIEVENAITFISNFCPRANVPVLFLDGEACLNGESILNGYKEMQDITPLFLNGESDFEGKYKLDEFREIQIFDFYPVQFLIHGEVLQKVNYFEQMQWLLKAALSLKEAGGMRIRSECYPRCNLQLSRLDGTQFLDGTHTLNEMDQDFESLFLGGSDCLDGEYIMNGYRDCHNFDFYPLDMKLSGSYKHKIELLGQSHFVSDTSFFIRSDSELEQKSLIEVKKGLKSEMQMLVSAQETVAYGEDKLTVEKDLWYLDGEQRLDGIVFLDADVYELGL